jgi:DNA-binding CsgD family transcriptional regulator
METLKNIIFLSYLLAAFLAIGGITISLLAKKQTKTELNNAILVFLFAMLAMCFYDWFIYYENYSFLGVSNTLALRLGSCMIAIIFYFWVSLEQKIVGTDKFDQTMRVFRIYVFAYAICWFVISVFFHGKVFYTIKFLLLFTDFVLLISMLLLSVVFMSKLILDGQKGVPVYMIIVTSMLIWNYVSFIWGEMSVYWGNSGFIRTPLDFTIIFWLIVNFATIYFVYNVDFSEAYAVDSEPAAPVFDLEERLTEMADEYGMTNREIDILRLIYRGMSNNEIAEELFISKSTVKSHIYNTFRKADVKSRSEIILLIHDKNYRSSNEE